MSKQDNEPTSHEIESLVTTFHRVKSLIPANQSLETVAPETRVAEALKKLDRQHYSQLPVVAGDMVLGIFSYRSFAAKALARQKSNRAEWLGDLPVEDFLEDFEFVHGNEDWNRVLRFLNQDDAFLVGNRTDPDELVTTIDVLNYFREIASPFIMIAEIEMSLRNIIAASIEPDMLPAAIERSLKNLYGDRELPAQLNELTFDNYVSIISNQQNWPYFEKMFGEAERSKKQTQDKLSQIRRWRNDIFHFKRRLEEWELDTITETREWLQRRVRAFEARKAKAALVRALADETTSSSDNSRSYVDRSSYLASCTPEIVDLVELIIAETEKNGFVINWGTKGFSIRANQGGRLTTVMYSYPPNIFDFYFGYLELEPAQEASLRRDLLSFGLFVERGKHTLRAELTATTKTIARKLISHCFARAAGLTMFPLTIQAILPEGILHAEMLDRSGRIQYGDQIYSSPSGAGKAASGWTAVNGWKFWQYIDPENGELVFIDALRQSGT